MTETNLPVVPADGPALARESRGLVVPLVEVREDLRKTLEHDLRRGLHLHTAAHRLGLLAQDAEQVAASYLGADLFGEHAQQIIRAAGHLSHLATQIRRAADAALPTTGSVRLILGEVDRALAWLGPDAATPA